MRTKLSDLQGQSSYAKLQTLLTLVIVLVLGGPGTALAAVQTVTVNDPIGDVQNNKPAYLDITQALVTNDDATFSMSMRLAAPIPLMPPIPKGVDGEYSGVFALDTQPGDPQGYPFSPGNERRFDQIVYLTWDGVAFHSFIVDRAPLLSGGEAITSDIPFSFNAERDEMTFVVDEALIGSPTTFTWATASSIRESFFGSQGYQVIDFTANANWP
jgi:hypothetical protein